MSTNKGGSLMRATACAHRDIQRDRHARARVKMRQKLRRRGNLGPLAHLPTAALVQLMRESK